MSAAAGFPPPYPGDNNNSVLRKPVAAHDIPAQNGSFSRPGGVSPGPLADGRHVEDLDAEIRKRVASFHRKSITQIIQAADIAFRMSDDFLNFRNRRDQAYIEFAVAYDLAFHKAKTCPEYPTMAAQQTGNNWRQLSTLQNKIGSKREQFKSIRAIIANENKRNELSPSTANPPPSILSPPSSRPQSQLFHVPNGAVTSPSSLQNGAIYPSAPAPFTASPISSPKSKPTIRPKPEALHGNAVKSLQERFAALRTSGATSPSTGALADPASLIRMPSPTDFKPDTSTPASNSLPVALRPAGPRPMPNLSSAAGNMPSLPPKLPLDTALAASLPRPPSPTYSPARNMQTPASVHPPRTSARSMVGTGGRAASVASSRPPGNDYEPNSYFPRRDNHVSIDDSRRKGMVGLSGEKSVTAEQLYDFVRLYSILLVDVRSRQKFDSGHIDERNIICVEPLSLRTGISAYDIESSLSISPDAEEAMFRSRDQYDFIVFYDQSTSSPSFLHSARTDQEERLRILYEALVEYNIDKPLKNPPMLLTGGIDAWADLLGKAALTTSRTQAGRPTRRRVSSVGGLPNALTPGRRREWNPLDADEERQWLEQARTESVVIPTVVAEEEPERRSMSLEAERDAQFYKTQADFLRRYPAVPTEQESMMVAPPRIDSRFISPPPSRPLSQSSYLSGSGQVEHEMPSRPVPAAPRVSYSGAHDRNALQPPNAVRSKNLAPYISWQEKPCNVRLPRTGLANFGSTCYMNSVVQSLSATIPLTMRFQDGSYKKWLQRDNWKGSRGLLPEHYANLTQNLWLNDVTACRPTTFRRFCARLNPDWGTDRHQDANDFYIFLMDFLHEDLNVYWRNPPPHVLSAQEETSREAAPMFLAAAIEWDRWAKREKSLISDLFAGQHASRLRCLTCGTTSTTYEPWFNLSIELPPRGPVLLDDCLASYTREERLDRGEEWSCPKCQTTRDATKQITLTKAPLYLVVHFKRFHNSASTGGSHKVSTVVNFPLQGLDLAPYMLQPPTTKDVAAVASRSFDQSTLGPFRYNAYAIVEHFGKGLQYGHYIAWVHDRARKVWRKFDDSSVTDVPEVKPAGAYLVFYERVNV